jgi:ethanolamine transporter EutH
LNEIAPPRQLNRYAVSLNLSNVIGFLLFFVAILLVTFAWSFLLLDKSTRSLRIWRRILSWVALLALSVSLVDLLLGLILVQGNNANYLNVLRRVVPTGFVATGIALLTCWFGTRKIVLCSSGSCVITGFLWLMTVIGA